MLHQYLILFGSLGLIAVLAILYALFCKTRRSQILFVGLVILVVGLWLDFRWGAGLIAQFNTRHFPKTTGEITYKNVTSYMHTGRFPGMRYNVNLTYRYSVNGQSYTGSRIRLIDDLSIFSSSGEKWGHSIGEQISVFYDPQNPQSALLSVGLNAADDWLMLIILAAANLFPFYCFGCVIFDKTKEKNDIAA